ncbi:MAG: HIT family protein, partial [Nanoarchaeota archaeon]|nr:HIT family protein [Nanoarchaeota archaeon]
MIIDYFYEGTMECILCKINGNEINYNGQLKEFEYWNVIVNRNQHTLATLVFILKRHTVRFSSLTEKELIELNEIQKKIEKAIDTLFKPNLYNYLQCGNEVNHLHIHLIPRYEKPISYSGKLFDDENYG